MSKQIAVAMSEFHSDGKFHIHALGCADIKKNKAGWPLKFWPETVSSLKDLVMSCYGPDAGSFFEEMGYEWNDPNAWKDYVGDFKVYPCCKGLPYEEEINLDEIPDSDRWAMEEAAELLAAKKSARKSSKAGDVVYETKARETGTLVQVVKQESGWMVRCDAHDGKAMYLKRINAELDAAHPLTWCWMCQELAA